MGTVGLPPLATSNKKSRRGRNSHGPEWPSGQVAKWPSGRRLDFSKVRPRWPLGQPVPRRCNHGRDARATFMARRRQPTWLIRRRSPHNGDHVCLPTSCQPDGSLWKAGGVGDCASIQSCILFVRRTTLFVLTDESSGGSATTGGTPEPRRPLISGPSAVVGGKGGRGAITDQLAKWPSGRRLDFSKVRPRWPLGH